MSAYTVRVHMRRGSPRMRARRFSMVRAALIIGSAVMLAVILGGCAAQLPVEPGAAPSAEECVLVEPDHKSVDWPCASHGSDSRDD